MSIGDHSVWIYAVELARFELDALEVRQLLKLPDNFMRGTRHMPVRLTRWVPRTSYMSALVSQ